MAERTKGTGSLKSRSPIVRRWWRLRRQYAEWSEQNLTREGIFAFLRTMMWVVPLTLLIWIWAEREQLDEQKGVRVSIEVQSDDRARVVRLESPADGAISLDLSGPRSSLERVRDALMGEVIGLEVPVQALGQQEFATVTLIEDEPMFRRMGVSITDVAPQRIRVFVDEIIDLEVPITVSDAVAARLDGPPIFDPPSVRLTGPRELLMPNGSATSAVIADLRAFAELNQPGAHDLHDIPLLRPFQDPHVQLSALRADATVRVRQADIQYVKPAMPVFVLAPGRVLEDFRVNYSATVSNITLVGPPKHIALLQDDSFEPQPKAYFEVTRDDATGEPRTRRLKFDLPPGITVSPEDANREIEFTMTPRRTGE